MVSVFLRCQPHLEFWFLTKCPDHMNLIGVLRDQAFHIMTSSLVLKGSRLMGFCGPLGKTHTPIDIEYVVFTLGQFLDLMQVCIVFVVVH